MKIKNGFEITDVCGEHVLMGMGEDNIDFSKVITFNETSYFIWQKMEEGVDSVETLVEALTAEYDVDAATAQKDVQALIDKLVKLGVVEA